MISCLDRSLSPCSLHHEDSFLPSRITTLPVTREIPCQWVPGLGHLNNFVTRNSLEPAGTLRPRWAAEAGPALEEGKCSLMGLGILTARLPRQPTSQRAPARW